MTKVKDLMFSDMTLDAQEQFKSNAEASRALLPLVIAAGERWGETFRTGAPDQAEAWEAYMAVSQRLRAYGDDNLRLVEDLSNYVGVGE